jgi:hypothetical protein
MCVGRHGFIEQIFGADEPVPRRRRRHLKNVRPCVLRSGVGPNSTFDPLCLTCPGQQWLGHFPVHGSDEQIFGTTAARRHWHILDQDTRGSGSATHGYPSDSQDNSRNCRNGHERIQYRRQW